MKYDPLKHHRHSIRLQGYDYSQVSAYFVTMVTYNRECLFGDIVDGEMRTNDIGRLVEEEWLKTARVRANVELDEFIVMPNHFHCVVAITSSVVGATRRVAPTGPTPNSIGSIMSQFKSIVTKRVNVLHNTQGTSVWQRNYHEHIIRNEKELDRIREYIINNPANWEADVENPMTVRLRHS